MSLYGYYRKTTPFLDEFFDSQGQVYTNARSNSSWTLPSFTSFMRSKLPSHIYVRDLLRTDNTLPGILRKNGISIVAFLKDFSKPISILKSVGMLFSQEEFRTFHYHDHETGFREATKWLHRYDAEDHMSQEPFFMFIHDTTVHNPYDETPEKYKKMFDTKVDLHVPITDRDYLNSLCFSPKKISEKEKYRITLLYDQGVRYLDDILKNFIESIPKKILESSIIIFTSDHGDEFGNHHNKFNHGHSLHEDIIRIPLAVRVPGVSPQRTLEPVSLLDLAPTILSIFSIDPPPDFEGLSFLHARKRKLFGKMLVAEGNLAPFPREMDLFTMKEDFLNKKIVSPLEYTSFVVGRWKFLKCDDRIEIFDVLSDPYEKNNLCGDSLFFSGGGGKKIRGFVLRAIFSATASLS